MAITTAVVIAGLAIAGFVYGKLRSRAPGEAGDCRVTGTDSAGPSTDDRPDAGRLAAARRATADATPAAAGAAAAAARTVSEWAPPKP